MRSDTINRLRRFALVGAVLGPGFWVLRWTLQFFHVLNSARLPLTTLGGYVIDVRCWDLLGFFLLVVTFSSLIFLYVIVCAPPRDIDQ